MNSTGTAFKSFSRASESIVTASEPPSSAFEPFSTGSLDSAKVGIFLLPLLAIIILHERPSIATFIGGALIVSAACFETWSIARKSRQ